MRISTTGIGLLSVSVSLLALSLSGCGSVSDASTHRGNGQGRGLGFGCNSQQQTVNNAESVSSERTFQGGGRGQGRGQGWGQARMVSFSNASHRCDSARGCSQSPAGCGNAESCSMEGGDCGASGICGLSGRAGRGQGRNAQQACGKSGGCQLTQTTCNDGQCSKSKPSACSGCDKVGAGCGTTTQGCGSKSKCGEGQTATGCEGCPKSGGACDVTDSEQVSPDEVSLDAFIGFGRGGGWGRRWWNEGTAPPLPEGDHGKVGCQDDKCPSEDDKQDETAE